jgi:hypothetical protein
MTLEQLKAQREALQAARFNGVLTVKAGDKWVTYKSDAELQSALHDLEREIAQTGRPPARPAHPHCLRERDCDEGIPEPAPQGGRDDRWLRGRTVRGASRPSHASRAHVNTLIQAAGADMTARARYLIRNNGYAANAVESWAGNAVGTGIKPSSGIADAVLKDRVQRLWLRWTDESDAEGLTDFYGQQRRAARELFIAGEVFFRIRPRRPEDGLSVPLQLQMLPAEMLPLNHNQALDNGHRIRQGIEFDRIGRRVAYHFLRRHPGDITDPGLAGKRCGCRPSRCCTSSIRWTPGNCVACRASPRRW